MHLRTVIIDNKKAQKQIDDFCEKQDSNEEEYQGLEFLLSRNPEHCTSIRIDDHCFFKQLPATKREHYISVVFNYDEKEVTIYAIKFEAQ